MLSMPIWTMLQNSSFAFTGARAAAAAAAALGGGAGYSPARRHRPAPRRRRARCSAHAAHGGRPAGSAVVGPGVGRRRHPVLVPCRLRNGVRRAACCQCRLLRFGERRQLLKLVAPVGHALATFVLVGLLGPLARRLAHLQQHHAVVTLLDANLPLVARVVRCEEDLVEVVAVRDDVDIARRDALGRECVHHVASGAAACARVTGRRRGTYDSKPTSACRAGGR